MQRTAILLNVLSDQNVTELELNYIKINTKPSYLEIKQCMKLSNAFLNNLWIREEISIKSRKYFELTGNENTTTIAVIKGKIIA